jgi:hypothetical protein
VIVDVVDFRLEGERVRGRMKGAATADWGSIGRDGSFQLDVRATMETDDGALVFCQYNGRCDVTEGFEAAGPVYAAPRFETGDERYQWLNKVQAVQKGTVDFAKGEITYRMYEVR